MQSIMDAIRAIRNARAEYNVEPARQIVAHIAAGERYELFSAQRDVLVELGRLDADGLRIARTLPDKPGQALTPVVGGVEIYLPTTVHLTNNSYDLDGDSLKYRWTQIGGPIVTGAGTQGTKRHCNGAGLSADTSGSSGTPRSIERTETSTCSSGLGLAPTSTLAATTRNSVTADAGGKLSLQATSTSNEITSVARITTLP